MTTDLDRHGALATASSGSAGQKPIHNPQDLVDAFKRDGSYDALRNEIMKEFLQSTRGEDFLDRIEDIIKRKHQATLSASSASTSTNERYSYRPSYNNPSPASPVKTNLKEFSEQAKRELSRHTAYERAETDMERDILHSSGKHVKGLEDTLRQIVAKRSFATVEKDQKPTEQKGDTEASTPRDMPGLR